MRGGILYFDGQFDDTRLLINLVSTAVNQNAAVLNYARVFALTKNAKNKIDGVNFQDVETGIIYEAKAKAVINATGTFCDEIRRLSDRKTENLIAPSQGIHLVFDKKFMPDSTALIIPKTATGAFYLQFRGTEKLSSAQPIHRLKRRNLSRKRLKKKSNLF